MKTKTESKHTPTPRVLKRTYAYEDVYYIGGFGQNRKAAEEALCAAKSYKTLLEAMKKMVSKVDSGEWQWAELSGFVAFELPKLIAQAEEKVS